VVTEFSKEGGEEISVESMVGESEGLQLGMFEEGIETLDRFVTEVEAELDGGEVGKSEEGVDDHWEGIDFESDGERGTKSME